MVSPYFIEGKLRFATRKGITSITEKVEEFISKSSSGIVCQHEIPSNLSPLFQSTSNFAKNALNKISVPFLSIALGRQP